MTERKHENYITVRRELWEYVQDGSLSIDDFLVLVVIHIKTNPVSGFCRTNYSDLAEEFKGKFEVNYLNKTFIRLRKRGLIWYEGHRGKRGKFLVIPHNYLKTDKHVTNISQLLEANPKLVRAAINERTNITAVPVQKPEQTFSPPSRTVTGREP